MLLFKQDQQLQEGLVDLKTANLSFLRMAALLQRKNYYFIPFGQDDSYKKPCSLKADFTQLPDTLEAALRGVQLQPILL